MPTQATRSADFSSLVRSSTWSGAPFLRHREPRRRRAEHQHFFDAAILGDGERVEAERAAALDQHGLVAADETDCS